MGEAQQRRDEVNSALDALEHCGLLSDTRAAESLLAAKAPRFGSRRLKQLLQAKSLDPSLVSDTLARAHETEFERAQQVWERRFDAPASTLQGRAKQQRFLAGRGFDAAVIDRVLKAAGQLSVAAFGDDTHSFTPDD